jgi:peptide/nickel transport system permease protein
MATESERLAPSAPAATRPGPLRRALDGDLFWSFRRSPVAVASAAITLVLVASALLAPVIAPHNPYDLASLSLLDSRNPPGWLEGGDWSFPLGSDEQGRDVLSAILYGMRLSLLVGAASVLFALVVGVGLGLLAGYSGGWVDALIMRIADVQLSFPAILIALLVDGIARSLLPHDQQDDIALYVIVFSIGVSGWVQYARTVRGSTMVERSREYVQAAQVIGVHPVMIALRHVLPNAMGPVLVIATLHLAGAIITEATLSFLGIGLPLTEPSLGTLIRVGNNFLFSGEWWILLFPATALAVLALAVNLLGDWLRDALNPKLR